MRSKNPPSYNIPKKDKEIAIIGAGISGMSCALRLATKKYRVDDLSTLNCDAVYIATGNNGNDFGLLQGWDNQTLGTNESRCFLGGMLAGASILESLEHGMRASKQIEKYILTGDVPDYTEEYPHENCERLMQVDMLPNQPVIVPASPEGYTKEEAIKEASRCLKCDCSL